MRTNRGYSGVRYIRNMGNEMILKPGTAPGFFVPRDSYRQQYKQCQENKYSLSLH